MGVRGGRLMADDFNTGSKDRATVALISEQVRGLRDLIEAKFTDVQRQLDDLSGLPLIVNGMIERQRQHDERIEGLEKVNDKRREYRMGPLAQNLIGFAGLIVSIAALVIVVGN